MQYEGIVYVQVHVYIHILSGVPSGRNYQPQNKATLAKFCTHTIVQCFASCCPSERSVGPTLSIQLIRAIIRILSTV